MANSHRKYMIWDFDGTLAWRPGGWTGAMLKVLRTSAPDIHATAEQIHPYLESGFPWHAPENAHPDLTADEWWEDLKPVFARAFRGVGVLNGEAYKLAGEVRGVYLDTLSWQRYKDTLPALEGLSACGWKHILLSNHIPELPSLLERLSLSSYFVAQFNSAQTGYEKPNPKAFRAVLDWVGPGPATWMVGDNFAVDVLGALEAGLPAILVRKPHPDAPIFCATLNEIAEKV